MARTTMTILMIEDEFLVAAEIRFHLERGLSARVEHAPTEAAALVAIANGTWDAAVVDANLNGRGIEGIASALLANRVPFIIVTGYGRRHLPSTVAEIVVIDKPFQPRTLVDAVARLCAQSGTDN